TFLISSMAQFNWYSGVASTKYISVTGICPVPVAACVSASLVEGVTLPSMKVSISPGKPLNVDAGAAFCATPPAELIRVSIVELLIQDAPAGQPATFGG